MKTENIAALGAIIISAAAIAYVAFPDKGLTPDELNIAQSLSLTNLPPLPDDPSNRFADNPAAIALGEKLFNDAALSSNQEVACATCHLEERQFQDDLQFGKGVGETARRTMPLNGIGYSPWLFWDGRKDSLWSQALGPIESAVEHGFTRGQVAQVIANSYAHEYTALFGPMPQTSPTPASPLGDQAAQDAWAAMPPDQQDAINRVYANFGKAVAAFERSLPPLENRLDRYVAALNANVAPDDPLSEQELDGFRIFIGKGACINCHNGPRLTDDFFHNTGVPGPDDQGRADAIAQVDADIFNCLGPYSDTNICPELQFMLRDDEHMVRAFKTPTLRGVADRPPYMHAGQFATLGLVIEHYNRAMPASQGHSELNRLTLTTEEKAALLAFLQLL